MSSLQPHGSLLPLAPRLYCIDGEWHGTSLARRMTVIVLRSGEILVHNPIRLNDATYAELEKLGRIAWIVAPNYLHSSEAHVYKTRYPEAKLFLCEKKNREWKGRTPVDGILSKDWPKSLADEVACLHLDGTQYIDESVFFHLESRTLIVTDLVFNMQIEPKGFEKIFYRLNRIYRRFGPSRIFKAFAIEDRERFRATLMKVLDWNFERVIMNHGEILETGGREKFRRGFEELGLL